MHLPTYLTLLIFAEEEPSSKSVKVVPTMNIGGVMPRPLGFVPPTYGVMQPRMYVLKLFLL